jgi:uncharacterized protein (DUF1684 family)
MYPTGLTWRRSESSSPRTPGRSTSARAPARRSASGLSPTCASGWPARSVRCRSTGWRGYGGGLFLPFGDATNGDSTYGGGRYLLDTVKGSDLGEVEGGIVLDFNFAYNPSCAYDPRWTCPLSPLESRLDIPVDAGELLPSSV